MGGLSPVTGDLTGQRLGTGRQRRHPNRNMLDLAVQQLALTGYSHAWITRARSAPAARRRVSVVVPCYNYGRYLPSCVGSVLAQQDVDVDVTIVDDASTDGSAEVGESLAADDARVTVHRNRTNLGHIASYNVGFSMVTGEYVLLLSADDILTPGALGRAVALLEARPSVGFAYGWSVPFEGGALPPARTRSRSWSVWRGRDWVADRCQRGCNVIRSSDAVVRRSVLEKVGGYREDLPHSGDFEWWMRAALVCDVGMLGGADQIYYRLHGENMSRTQYASTIINLHETKRAFDAALGGSDADSVHMLRRAHRKLARQAIQFAIADYMAGEQDDLTIESYKDFAVATDPQVVRSREWRALVRRRTIGMPRARRNPGFRGRELVRDLEGRLRWLRWRFSGI